VECLPARALQWQAGEAYSSGVSRKENIFFLCELCASSEVYPVECLCFSIQLRASGEKIFPLIYAPTHNMMQNTRGI
jgi:hypothetical protein